MDPTVTVLSHRSSGSVFENLSVRSEWMKRLPNNSRSSQNCGSGCSVTKVDRAESSNEGRSDVLMLARGVT